MRISLIAAIGQQGQIGLNNELLWHIREDLINFKKVTLGHHILMGRKTFQSIGKPLPKRQNIVVSRSGLELAGIKQVSSLTEGFELAASEGEQELFVIGGGDIYRQALPYASKIYLSKVDYTGQADTFFPEYKHLTWTSIYKESHAEENAMAWTYEILERRPEPWS